MTSAQFICARKLFLTRALVLRLGYAWLRRVNATGIGVRAIDWCTPGLWTPAMSNLEEFMRAYGFIDPIDDLGPARELTARIAKVLERDLKLAAHNQLPEEKETAGSERTYSGRPHGLLSLTDLMAAEFNLTTLKDGMPSAPSVSDTTEGAGPSFLAPNGVERVVARLAAAGLPVDHHSLRAQLERAVKEQCAKQRKQRTDTRQRWKEKQPTYNDKSLRSHSKNVLKKLSKTATDAEAFKAE